MLSGADIDPDAGQTFRLNFPEASFFEGPISALTADAILRDAKLKPGQLDCLVGGPPCQSFSYNNHQRSATNARARLFRDYLRIVAALKPKLLVMENVPGMLTINGGRIIDEIKGSLSDLGYETEIRILYAEDYGVPQARRRAFVVGSKIGSPKSIFPAGTCGPSLKPSEEANPLVHRWKPRRKKELAPFVTVWDAIGDLPTLESGGGDRVLPYGSKKAVSKYQRKMRGRAANVYNHVCHDLTAAMLKKIAYVPEGGNWTDIPRRLLPPGMLRAVKTCHTKRYGRLDRRALASTVLTKCDPHWGAYVHPTQNRTISVREAARLQGFPDKFHFAGSFTYKQYAQVGNAVPVPVARALGLALKRQIKLAARRGRKSSKRK